MKAGLILLLILFFQTIYSQSQNLSGIIVDDEMNPLISSSIALLDPQDSTLVHFTITNREGMFTLRKVPFGHYILQVSYVGFQSFYKSMLLPLNTGEDLGTMILMPLTLSLSGVEVNAERIPILVKRDTIEYQADAFKTKPDAVAEDLLKRLPGVEVDRAGNVKAMGEKVNQVLVDGKEFFSSDPKVATKNLPASGISKVQVYDKKTDEAELLGLDDTDYDKTINFILKDGMKHALFGDVKAGGDLEEHYQFNARAYRFSEKHQFALLGMINNINQLGFSLQEYIDFNGGLRNFASSEPGGQSITITANEGTPLDLGQSVKGLIRSAAGGLNYSYEPIKNKRFNISYLGNTSHKTIEELTSTRLFTETGEFVEDESEYGMGDNHNHLINFGLRNKSRPNQHSIVNGIVSISKNTADAERFSRGSYQGTLKNSQQSYSSNSANRLNTSLNGSWMHKSESYWKLLKMNTRLYYKTTIDEGFWKNISQIGGSTNISESLLLDLSNYSGYGIQTTISGLGKLYGNLYLEPALTGGYTQEDFQRTRNGQSSEIIPIDTLNPGISTNYHWIKPKIIMKIFSGKVKLRMGMEWEMGQWDNSLNDTHSLERQLNYLLPQFLWEYEYKTGCRLGIQYATRLTQPAIYQLQALISHANPFAIYKGNRELKPEYSHNLNLSWFLLDQFSFTSIFFHVDGSYTREKIGRSIVIDEDLRHIIQLINVPEGYSASAEMNLSTPIRPLRIMLSLDLSERWNKTTSYINKTENINTNLTHSIRFSMSNRRKENWDAEMGIGVHITDSKYSIQDQLNRVYFNSNIFGDLRYHPSNRWYVGLNVEITRYDAESFDQPHLIPLLGGEVQYYLSKNRRYALSLKAMDVLNKNEDLDRISELNYLRESHSNTLGRCVMLSLSYRINPAASEQNTGIRIETRK